MTDVTFDTVLGTFSEIAVSILGVKAFHVNFFLRDANGKLTFILRDESLSNDERAALVSAANTQMAKFVDGEFAVASPEQLFDDELETITELCSVSVHVFGSLRQVPLLDRSLFGYDWTRPRLSKCATPPRIAFVSMKGGVGRSSALCILAAELASKGKRVLVVDLDLESPGVGSMLLDQDSMPEYGVLDYLVERNIAPVSDAIIEDMVGYSRLSTRPISVMPAMGRTSIASPENVLAKLGRAYLADSNKSGDIRTFTDHIEEMLTRVTKRTRYDAILIDSRAGMHETTAASVIGLGASVLCFCVDELQSYAAYRMTFAYLATLPRARCDNADWRSNMHFVHAKARLDDADSERRFAANVESLRVVMKSYAKPIAEPLPVDAHSFESVGGVDAMGQPLTADGASGLNDSVPALAEMVICDGARCLLLNSLIESRTFESGAYQAAYGKFLAGCAALLDPAA